MRLVIDLQAAQTPETANRGIGRYSLGLAGAIARNRGPHDVHLVLNGGYPESVRSIRNWFAGLLPPGRIHTFDVLDPLPDEPSDPRRLVSELTRETLLAQLRPDIVHLSTAIEGIRGDSVCSIGRLHSSFATTATLYDLIPLAHRDRYLSDPADAEWYARRLQQLCRADLLLAISQFAADEATQLLGPCAPSISVVGAAADAGWSAQDQASKAARLTLSSLCIDRPFILHTGGADARKNVDALIRAYAALPTQVRAGHQVVIVGELPDHELLRLRTLSRSLSISDEDLILTGFVSDLALAQLYSAARLFVFPSLHEGFGLPVLEAMQCGAPVIGSDSASIPEVIGNAEALFDASDPAAIGGLLLSTLTSDEILGKLRAHSRRQARRFSWDKVARRAIAAFERLDIQHVSRERLKRPRKPRLAFVSPIPPARSGIAAYAASLLPALSNDYDVDVVVDSSTSDRQAPAGASAVVGAGDFKRTAHRYDRVVYNLGNSEFHDYMLDLFRAVPGVVVLHEFSLGGLVRHASLKANGERGWLAALYENHGLGALLAEMEHGQPAETASIYPCCTSIIADSLGVIAHSDAARSLASQWLKPQSAEDLAVVPLPATPADLPPRHVARKRLGIADGAKLIRSFGLMGLAKCNSDLLSAWLDSAMSQDPDARLMFVGGRDSGGQAEAIEQAILRHSLQLRVGMTGWVDEETYRDYLAACDLAVQLRAFSGGEASLSALDCLMNGLKTIANFGSHLPEVPSSGLILLPEKFTPGELCTAIDGIWHGSEKPRRSPPNRKAAMKAPNRPKAVAEKFSAAVEQFYLRRVDLVPRLANLSRGFSDEDKARLSASVNRALQPAAVTTMHLDISDLADGQLKDESTVRLWTIVADLARVVPAGLKLQLIRYDEGLQAYRQANASLSRLLKLDRSFGADEVVEIMPGDLMLCFDSRQSSVAARGKVLGALHQRGVQLFHLIDDIRQPSVSNDADAATATFEAWLATLVDSNGLICSSESLAGELSSCMERIGPGSLPPISIASGWLRFRSASRESAEAAAKLLSVAGVPVDA